MTADPPLRSRHCTAPHGAPDTQGDARDTAFHTALDTCHIAGRMVCHMVGMNPGTAVPGRARHTFCCTALVRASGIAPRMDPLRDLGMARCNDRGISPHTALGKCRGRGLTNCRCTALYSVFLRHCHGQGSTGRCKRRNLRFLSLRPRPPAGL